MWHKLFEDATLYGLLLKIDEELCEKARLAGCQHCGAPLHRADYPRKPRGVETSFLPEAYDRRLSLCCSRQGCRKRTTPPSVRYLGRKVYLGAIVALAAAMRQGPEPWVVARLDALLGVGRRTLNRWRSWWGDVFVATPMWRILRAQIIPVVDETGLPLSLLERLCGVGADPRSRLIALLRLLQPLTTASHGQDGSGCCSPRRRCAVLSSKEVF